MTTRVPAHEAPDAAPRLRGGVLKYFLLLVALSIPFWIAGSVALPVPMNLPVSALQAVCPLLAALVTHAVVSGRADLAPSTRAGVLLVGVGVGNALLILVARVLGDVDDVAVPGSAATAAAAISALVILAGCGLLLVGWSRQRPSPTSHQH